MDQTHRNVQFMHLLSSNEVREISEPGCLILIGMEIDFAHSITTTVLDVLTLSTHVNK